MWWAMMPCTCKMKKNVMMKRTESRMEIEEIVKMKLETIKEEADEMMTISRDRVNGVGAIIKLHRTDSNMIKVRKTSTAGSSDLVMGKKMLTSKRRIKDSYVLLMNGFASKAGIGGLPRY